MTRRTGSVLIATVAALTLAACGGTQDSEEASSPNPSASTISPSDMTDQQRPADRLTIDVSIEGGTVTPTNARLQGKVGEPIVLRVNSDAADELHVHSVPEHTFKVEPKDGQQFQFTAEVPGNIDIELHELNRVIASVQVQ
ncbi:hypothetical protein [Mycobacterium sp. GA-2829]|uniref:hypothetical protein n=1 Tax=Mycobacterium sp. GA-2829 TaxID=1772283 RepID=UPI00073FB253|nr:hypothetical protein [Mycobacterium sp. GA-2829]KUI31468.1 hypothetical protein AU194_28530 [Mycobacterium sp. GA-2829]